MNTADELEFKARLSALLDILEEIRISSIAPTYILNGKTPMLCKDLEAWSQWLKTADLHVAWDKINGVTVSTVFLGTDYNHSGKGAPLLFETKVFGGSILDDIVERHATWDAAVKGHQVWVNRAKMRVVS